jgi:hypothetical protein
MPRLEFEKHIWNACMRIGMFEGSELYFIKCGKSKAPELLPHKLIMLINQNFDDLYKVNRFFAPIHKVNNYPLFLKMLSKIAPFKERDILFEGALFSVVRKPIQEEVTTYEG